METLQDSLKYREWATDMASNEIDIRSVEELNTVRKRNGEVLFSMIRMDAVSPEGNKILPIALLRGNFVSVLTCLIDKDTKEKFLLLVKQRRVANGAIFYEMPAGMTDSTSDPYEVAIHEMKEETGLDIGWMSLNLLNDELLFSSPGLTDEGGWFFYVELELPREQINALHDQATGAAGEHEFIRTHLCTFEEAKTLIKNLNGLVNIYLYEERKRSLEQNLEN